MRAAALPPPPARLASLRHNAAVEHRAAQEKAKSDVSTPYKQAGALLLPCMLAVTHEYVYKDKHKILVFVICIQCRCVFVFCLSARPNQSCIFRPNQSAMVIPFAIQGMACANG